MPSHRPPSTATSPAATPAIHASPGASLLPPSKPMSGSPSPRSPPGGQQLPARPSSKLSNSLAINGTDLRADGIYAAELIAKLDAAGGKVVNRSDLLQPLDPGVPMWGPWHLEPVWLMVVAAALCQQGKLEISIDGQRIDALGLDRLTRYAPDQLAAFDHLAPPKTLPVTQLRSVVAHPRYRRPGR